ncbi:hypothetical protein GCM10010917_39900 [Paenibacillus physcomitrellae]|uniref:Uncharacterized protein n=1 Tax=Paenibacillus physcomitrellae TaxID=1619311 RepID=A0ABQ1GVI8_9BACL|nr:hypothetical protein GCM10010917_39900 [Paenibacillus physcomitrellae]
MNLTVHGRRFREEKVKIAILIGEPLPLTSLVAAITVIVTITMTMIVLLTRGV